jgi:hypothetical protein
VNEQPSLVDVWVPAVGVLFAEVDGETVLLDSRTGSYFSLNEVGARTWPQLSAGVPLGTIHQGLLADYDVASDVLWSDLKELITALAAAGLVARLSTT